MAGRAVLHVGTMKTGTTYLQSVLVGNKELLAERGIAVPATFARQTKAVNGVLRSDPGGPRGRGGATAWDRLVRQAARSSEHTAVLSMEFLSFARGRRVGQLVRPFEKHGFDELDVVLTVRDQFRVLPAQWQTFCRNTGTTGWADYLRVIEQSRPARAHARAHRTFHRAQDVPEILEQWSAARGVTRVHVVTLPPPDTPRDELWRRFCEVLGVSAQGFDLDVAWQNVSLGYGSCDLLRRVNVHLQDVPGRAYRAGMRALARGALVDRRGEESRPRLDRRGARFAGARNQAVRDAVVAASRAGSRVLLHGTLDELPVAADLADFASRVSPPTEDEVWASGETARAFLCRASGAVAAEVSTLDELATDVARLLRVANSW